MGDILTNTVMTEPFTIGDAAKAVRFDYFTLENFNCPIILFDHLHMSGASFPPHPHAGLAVFSYVFEDSRGTLRDRDSLNAEVLVEPGDLLWFQMGTGLIHEENPSCEGAEVHQMQVWINMSSASQALPPATLLLKSADVPVISNGIGRVRIVLGEYGGLSSSFETTEPFVFLEIFNPKNMSVPVAKGWSGIVYAVGGEVEVTAGGERRALKPGEVVGVREGAKMRLSGASGHVLYMARPLLEQPMVIQGMYAMESQEAIDEAKRRFHAGEFGDVPPYAKLIHPDEPYLPAGQDPDVTVTAVVQRQATVRHYDEGWWRLHFQYCLYRYSDYETAYGYRFVWEDPDGAEKPYRHAGYIPYMEYVRTLLTIAEREGWGDLPYRDSF